MIEDLGHHKTRNCTNALIVSVIVLSCLIIAIGSATATESSYILTLSYNKGANNVVTTTIDSVSVEMAVPTAQEYSMDKRYTLKLYDAFGEQVESFSFDFPTSLSVERKKECFQTDPTTGQTVYNNDGVCDPLPGYVELDSAKQYIVLPYSPIGKDFKLYDKDNNLVATKSVADHMDYCGDGICSDSEDYDLCPIDPCKDKPMVYTPLGKFYVDDQDSVEISADQKFTVYHDIKCEGTVTTGG